MFPSEITEKTEASVWEDLMARGQKVLESSALPPDSSIQVSNNINMNNGEKQIFAKMSFPFIPKSPADTSMFINLVVSGSGLYGMSVGEFPFGRRIIEPKHSEPHLESHTLDFESVNWFRIWYGSGFKRNEFGDGYGYYAVSGDKLKLDELGIGNELSDIFTLINSAQADSMDFNYLRPERKGDSEYIYLRFKMNNEPYSQFGETTVYYTIEEEDRKPEELSDYIVVKHSKKTRYFYQNDKNPELVEALKNITYRDYGRHQEKRWK